MNPWSLLGLDADVDTRSIKRRYAQLLKQHRPDEDAEAFQRLREAYEWAMTLAIARQDVNPDDALAMPAQGRAELHRSADLAQALTAPNVATIAVDAQARIRQLLEACPSLDEAFRQARAQGLDADFQRYLLSRCMPFDEQGVITLRWCMQQLHWLSPWQADYLPQAALNDLAVRLLALELEQLQRRLQAGEERAVLEAVAALVVSDWLQSFDRRLQLQLGLIHMLESTEQWSAAFFERLGKLFGWEEEKGELPCSAERWYSLCWRCEREAAGQRLQQHLQEFWPLNAEQRAAWLLLKPLTERECRRLVDQFSENDWQACEALDELLNARYPDLPAQLGLATPDGWRRWQPRKWTAPAAAYAWLLLFAALFGDALYGSGAVAARSSEMSQLVFNSLITSLGLIAILVCLVRSWSWLARFLTALDVRLSRLLLPAAWRDHGAGMLLLRHGVPAALFAALVAFFAPDMLESRVVFAVAFALQLVFLLLVGSGRSPWPRLALFKRRLFRTDYSRPAEW
ncbi:hypothetical protein SAMN05216600_10847 [Pseudomonas cuatrocienegasensis]|uniref:J domain-containing protein n=1 Tax=Pseudomonas cuatrocienegasensis TaxID=543360 RepID=A0ABY1BE88_9PSED|nr:MULTISPECIES: J domain-containing protein [Pseudomonas]OEC34713.1 hypothetical protein A7D25_12495 [Pseudomonas sp. 21C1]SEQ64745.1 hypothetical protein SAMN05216600_10847 [Pseudomonas cuatrocienegasensis]